MKWHRNNERPILATNNRYSLNVQCMVGQIAFNGRYDYMRRCWIIDHANKRLELEDNKITAWRY